jgi:hypothetical protein
MKSKITDPDNQDGKVDRKNPKHEYQQRVGIVVKIIHEFRVL